MLQLAIFLDILYKDASLLQIRKLALCLVCAVSLAACAARTPDQLEHTGQTPAGTTEQGHTATFKLASQQIPVQTPLSQQEQKALTAWKSYVVKAGQLIQIPGAFRLNGALRYTTPEESNRISFILWGNGKKNNPYPLRLDLLAGIGNIVSSVEETEIEMHAYVPAEKVVYRQTGGPKALVAIGIPVPFGLNDMVLLLTGHGQTLFVPAPFSTSAPMPTQYAITKEGVLFTISDAPFGGQLLLSHEGVPLRWQESGGKGWVMHLESDAATPLRAKKLRINHPNGYDALITVYGISAMPAPFTPAQLGIPAPQNTPVRPFPGRE